MHLSVFFIELANVNPIFNIDAYIGTSKSRIRIENFVSKFINEYCNGYISRKVYIVIITIVVMVTMNYKTINVTSKTYEKLVLYKHGNMSFDDVLNEFMNQIEERKFYNHILKEHKKRMRKIKSGDYVESDNIEDALKNA